MNIEKNSKGAAFIENRRKARLNISSTDLYQQKKKILEKCKHNIGAGRL